MADAVLLSQDTYDRLKKMLEKWEAGQIVEVGEGLLTVETGTGYQKIGVDIASLLGLIGLPSGTILNTITLDVCVDGSPKTHTFVITN